MYATLQGFWSEPNLSEHGRGNFCMNWFTAMRSARESDLLFSEAEAVSSAGSHQRNCLVWFRRGAQISDRLACTKICGDGSIGFHCHDVAAMTRFCDSAAGHLNQRFGGRYLFVVFRRLPGNLHSCPDFLTNNWN